MSVSELTQHLEGMADSLDDHVTHEDIHRLLIEALEMSREQDIKNAADREPRRITTLEELSELHMVVVRSDAGTIANVVSGKIYCFGFDQSAPVSALQLPVTVLWETP